MDCLLQREAPCRRQTEMLACFQCSERRQPPSHAQHCKHKIHHSPKKKSLELLPAAPPPSLHHRHTCLQELSASVHVQAWCFGKLSVRARRATTTTCSTETDPKRRHDDPSTTRLSGHSARQAAMAVRSVFEVQLSHTYWRPRHLRLNQLGPFVPCAQHFHRTNPAAKQCRYNPHRCVHQVRHKKAQPALEVSSVAGK